MDNKQKRISQILQEAIGADISGQTPITKFKDHPIIEEILSFFKKEFKKEAEIINIVGNGDQWTLDVRAKIDPVQHAQYTREIAKERAYMIKRSLEGHMMKSFNLPSMSISGVRSHNNNVEFSIGFIFSNSNIQSLFETNNLTSKIISEVLEDSYEELELDENGNFKAGTIVNYVTPNNTITHGTIIEPLNSKKKTEYYKIKGSDGRIITLRYNHAATLDTQSKIGTGRFAIVLH